MAPLTNPGSPATPEGLEGKRKKRPSSKSAKSPQPVPVSPLSAGAYEEEKQRQKPSKVSPRKERKQSTPPAPPLAGNISPIPPLSEETPSTKAGKISPKSGKSSTRNKSSSKSGSKSSNKSVSNRSPRTDLKHRQVANAAAEAASLRRHRRPRKKLYWNNSVRVKVVHNLSNYTPQEKLDSWYSADEYSMMEDECELTSIYMDEIAFERENVIHEEKKSRSYKRNLPNGFCDRGLESWTMLGEELKEQQVSLVIDTVWQAQIDAWEFLATEAQDADDKSENEIHNECWEFIRERASDVSKPSQMRAREFAIKDEQEVDSYLNSVRSLEQSRRRITKMLRQKQPSSRSMKTSSRTLTTVSSSESRSLCGPENLKSILKSPKPKRSHSDTRSLRKSPSQSLIPLKSSSEHSKDGSGSSFRIRLPKIGDDGNSLLSKSLRSRSLRSNSLRSNSLRSNSLRSNNNSLSHRSSSLRSNNNSLSHRSSNNSLRSNNNSLRSNSHRSTSLRSQLSRSQSVRTSSVRSNNHSLRSNLSRSNSLRSHSLRSHGSNSVCSNVSSSSLLSNSSKKIRYKPKSKIKVPTSPVGSVCGSVLSQNYSNSNHASLSEEEDLSMRMMRSHMSFESEGSSRRRMLRVSTPKPPL